MTNFKKYNAEDKFKRPVVLTIPGLGNSGSEHWQTHWERERNDCHRVDLGDWEKPHRNTWVNKLNLAIIRADRPVVLVAHSLGCLTVAWWARYEQPGPAGPVIGALLVAPPEVDFFPIDERLAKFAPTPEEPLPFPSILVASRNDPYMEADRRGGWPGPGAAGSRMLAMPDISMRIRDLAIGRLANSCSAGCSGISKVIAPFRPMTLLAQARSRASRLDARPRLQIPTCDWL